MGNKNRSRQNRKQARERYANWRKTRAAQRHEAAAFVASRLGTHADMFAAWESFLRERGIVNWGAKGFVKFVEDLEKELV